MSDRSFCFKPGWVARLVFAGSWTIAFDEDAPDKVRLKLGREIEVDGVDIRTISVSRSLWWYTVTVGTQLTAYALKGLSAKSSSELSAELRRHVNRGLSEVITTFSDRLRASDTAIRSLTEDNQRYLARVDLAQALARMPGTATAAFTHPLFDSALISPAARAAIPESLQLLIDPTARQRYNEAFLAAELIRFKSFFDDVDGRSLSDQQREACIRLEDTNLLVASAGSGKSATMVGKVAYVAEKGLYRPEEILVLAFNKSAADEIRWRIARQMRLDPKTLETKVTTFHALGRAILREVYGRPPQLANWVEHPAGEAKVIEELVTELLDEDPEFERLWIELLVVHPKADLPVEVFDSEADYRRYVSDRVDGDGATIGSLAGVFVRSLQERMIANWLWLNGVEFEYEAQFAVEDEEGIAGHVHPDFYYPSVGAVHEHFAINADGTSPFPDYVGHANIKRMAYSRASLDLIETRSAQASDGTLLDRLHDELSRRKVQLVRRSSAEITEALQPVLIKHYHQLIATSIKHIRANHLSRDVLMERAESLHDKERSRLFAKLVWTIADRYSQKLRDIDRIDFDAMIADATRLVETGQYQSPFSLILVDEFQDISEPAAKLIRALKGQQSFAKLFAVGDDWQSIYRFAGSDISIFTQFEQNFGASWIGRLEQTYRSNQLIAKTAADFVQRNPEQLRKQVRSARATIPKSIRVVPVIPERGKPDYGDACQRLLRRLDDFLGGMADQWRTPGIDKLKVLVLWRYNHLDPLRKEPSRFANIDVSGMSFHRSKGLEADYTILVDISEGDYGVPARMEDDELLHLVIPWPEQFPYAEERRLFYVALTRASRGVFLLTNARRPSLFIKELSEVAKDDIRFETLEGQLLQQCPSCLVGHMVEKRAKVGRTFLGCNLWPECKHTAPAAKPA